MNTRKLIAMSVLSYSLLLLLGCPSLYLDPRTSNQGGSNPIQAIGKLAMNRLDLLNPDDVQVLTDIAIAVTDSAAPPVEDEQAAAVISFMQAHNLDTFEDVEAIIEQAETEPGSIVIPEEVRLVFEQLRDPRVRQAFQSYLNP